VYRIVRLSSKESEQQDSRLAVIASGFTDSAAASFTAANWVRRHCPQARYDEETGRWLMEDHDGWMHSFFVEPTVRHRAGGPER